MIWASESDWEHIRFFKPHEWGAWRMVSSALIHHVDALRELVGKPCKIHGAYATDGHSPNSTHYRGLAVDLHFKGMHVVDQFLLAEKSRLFHGIGVYPHWHNPGLHLDLGDPGRRWMRDKDGKYLPLNWTNLLLECK